MALIEFENYPSTDTAINADNLNNNFKELGDNVEALELPDDWETVTSDYGTLYYKIINGICYTAGTFSGLETNGGSVVVATLPFTVSKQHVWLCQGSSSYTIKAVLNANTNSLSMMNGSGTISTTYNFNFPILIN